MELSEETIKQLYECPGQPIITSEYSYVILKDGKVLSYDLWYYNDEDGIRTPEWDVHVLEEI